MFLHWFSCNRTSTYNNEEVTNDGNDACEDSFNDEDPSPASVALDALHLHQTKGEDTCASGRQGTDEVEDAVALVHVVASVPC